MVSLSNGESLTFSKEVQRLLGYVRPHLVRCLAGVFLMAILGLAEGLIALMIVPVIDVVLNPHSTDQTLTLIQFHGHSIDLNSFFPHSIHHVWTIFSLSLLAIFFVKALAEFLGSRNAAPSALSVRIRANRASAVYGPARSSLVAAMGGGAENTERL